MENKVGTAPGLFARIGDAEVFVVPGVPSEMEWMFDNQIAPRLSRNEGVIIHRTIHTFGAGESDVGTKILDLMQKTGPHYCCSDSGVSLIFLSDTTTGVSRPTISASASPTPSAAACGKRRPSRISTGTRTARLRAARRPIS